MKRYILFRLILVNVFMLFLVFFLPGCDEDSTSPEEAQPIDEDLFPLVQGRIIVYGEGNLFFNDTQDSIPGTGNGFNSKWEVGLNVPPNPVVIYDTTNIPALGVVSPREFYIQKDEETGNFDFLTNLGYLFRSQQIYNTPGDSISGVRGDSLVWIGLSKSTEGVDREWVAYTSNFTTGTLGPIKFEIVGKFELETLTLAGTNYDTYKLTATRKIYLGSSTVAASTGTTAVLWLAANIGPVKIILIGDAESHGKVQTMTSKNF